MKNVAEGKAKIIVPEESVSRNSCVFYNPGMAHARNAIVSFMSVFRKKADHDLVVCDPMAASGVRGIRLLKEVNGIEKVVFNDANPEAVELIKNNLELNKIPKEKYEIENKDCNLLFLERKREFDFIDIDPFGSPVNFLPNVWSALKKDASLAVSATDTGALSGSFRSTCENRYGVIAEKTDFFKEFGISTLVQTVVRELAKHDIVFSPLFSHTQHYFRVVGLTQKGKEKTHKNLENISLVSYCPECYSKEIGVLEKCPNCGKPNKIIGPMWVGKTKDSELCDEVLKDMISRGFRDTKDIYACTQEIDEPFYYDIHKICKNLKSEVPKLSDFFEKMENNGFQISRTHLSDLGFKTDAKIKDIEKILKSKL
ncbi:MAG: tRNA (guanine(10)-N(2))-dimethyltransferase [Candidatus Aenigmarchaeota archaeon]|nr:tRNA (guanine(10)-N(2))-dimethyltransferase [Candidatus Aenigmarchaeota archaeon]